MRSPKTALFTVYLSISLLTAGCAERNRYETETTISSSPAPSSNRVVKDEIPAEGQRKIPVVQQY
jgi:hypothetical protein